MGAGGGAPGAGWRRAQGVRAGDYKRQTPAAPPARPPTPKLPLCMPTCCPRNWKRAWLDTQPMVVSNIWNCPRALTVLRLSALRPTALPARMGAYLPGGGYGGYGAGGARA
jgi:hypothetical protein